MKKNLAYVLIAIVAFVLGCVCCCSMCCKKTAKIAVVDVQRVVSQSRPVAELRQDVQAQMGSLQQWIEASNTEINNEKSPEKKEALTKQRQEELMQKQQLIQSDYAEKLQKLDADLTATIEKTAKAEGFNITLVKGSVATGGTDITEKVIENLTK